MRRWVWPVVLAMVLAVVLAGCTTGAPARETAAGTAGQIPGDWLPGLDEVVSLRLNLGLPLERAQAPQPLHATHPLHRATIAHLLDLLAQARLAAGELSTPARSPVLSLALQGGGSVSARLAFDCTPFTSEDGHGYTCKHAPGEVILYTRQGREVRVTAQPMAAWLLGGWRADLPIGSLPDMDRETALTIAHKTDARAAWKATFYAEYPVEGKGGTEVRRAWMMEAEYPAGNKTRLVIDAQTGQVIWFGQLEALQ